MILRLTTMVKGSQLVSDEVAKALLPDSPESLSFLDIGCWDGKATKRVPAAQKTHVDVIRHPSAPEPFVQSDGVTFLETSGQVGMIFAFDMIEHMERPKADRFLELVTRKADRLALFFTPLGPLKVTTHSTDPFIQKSSWYPEDFEQWGYSTWVFPRFHDPWEDGKVHGAIFAWLWNGHGDFRRPLEAALRMEGK